MIGKMLLIYQGYEIMRTYEVKIQVGWIEFVGQTIDRCLMQGLPGMPLAIQDSSKPEFLRIEKIK